MLLKQSEHEEPRYDAATLRKVAALAERLQNERRESLSAREIENIGTEVGLEPSFVREALARVVAEQETIQSPAQAHSAQLAGIGIGAAVYSGLTYVASFQRVFEGGGLLMFWVTLPILLPILVGAFTKKSKLGLFAGAAVILTNLIAGTLLTMAETAGNSSGDPGFWMMAFLYVLIGLPLAAGSGWFAGWLREPPKRSPRRTVAEPDRQELLGTLFALQRQLEGPKVYRTFLSVDVAGAAELKRGEAELTVEYSFGEFRQWVEEIAAAHGGQVLPAVTEGVLCVFPDGIAAARAARQIQETLRRFNDSGNKLSRPFRVRCGISGGELSAGSLQPNCRPQSWLVDHALSLQRTAEPGDILISESAAGPALGVLGSLARVTQPVEGEPAFTWRGTGGPQTAATG